MSECFKVFSICLGWGFFAHGNAISHMQLLTQICQVLLAEEETHFWSQRSCLHLLSVVTELGKTLSDGQNMQKYELKTKEIEVFGERGDHKAEPV